MTKRSNILFMVLDAVRFDVFQERDDARILAPNLMRLVDEGMLARVVSNGMITKVAMGPLLTQTYPLDYGGYNDVIASRPASFVELLRDAGYATYMQISHFVTGPIGMVERGAEKVDSVWDHHMVLEMYFNHVLNHELNLWKEGERSDDEIASRISNEMASVIEYIEGSQDRLDLGFLPKRLRKLSRREASRYAAERSLIRQDPLLVARKILSIPAKNYRLCLGRKGGGAIVSWAGRWGSLKAKINKVLQFVFRQPIQLFPGYVAPVASEVRRVAMRTLAEQDRPWFAFVHFMDAHDSKRLNRPLNFLRKLTYLPRLWKIKREGATARDPLYDLSVAYMDAQVGLFLKQLVQCGQRDDLIVVGVGDHGFGWDQERSKSLLAELGFRTHYEHIAVPFILSPTKRQPRGNGLFDTMSVSATLLDEIGLTPHSSFRGRSVFKGGQPFSLVETVGRGNVDLVRRDIYFTISTRSHKLMVVLRGNELFPQRFYDLSADPRELCNLAEDPAQRSNIKDVMAYLWQERSHLLDGRGAERPNGQDA